MSRVELAGLSSRARTLAAAYHAAFAEWPLLSAVGDGLTQAAAAPRSTLRGLAVDPADALAELLRTRLAERGYAELLAGSADPCAEEREQTMQRIETRLAVGLSLIPSVAYAGVFGSWAARHLRDGSDLDLLCLFDLPGGELANEIAAYDTDLDRVYDLVREVEKDAWPLAEGIQVVDRVLDEWHVQCANPSSFVVDLYAKPRVELLSSFEATLPEQTLMLVREQTLAYLKNARAMGRLDPALTGRLAELEAQSDARAASAA